MKPIATLFLALLLCFYPPPTQAVIADGDGIFPVVVQVTNEHGEPLQGAGVRLLDSGRAEADTTFDPARRRWISLLERPVQSDAFGSAIVYYYGRWSSRTSADGTRLLSRKVRGRIVVEAAGFTPAETNVVQDGSAKTTSNDRAPIVTVTLKRAKPQ